MNFPFVTDDKPKEQLQRSLAKVTETGCNDECSHNREATETRSSTPEMPAVSAFFSLAALAEVAAMENVHRSAVGNLAALGSGDPVQFHPLSRNMGGDSDMEAQIILSDVVCGIFHNDWGSGDFCLRGVNQSIYTVQQCGKI